MNNKERYIKSTLFGKPDRITFSPQSGRESTREAWHKQGLPANIKANEITKYAFSLIGSPYEFPASGQIFFVDERMNPLFEEKILEVFETTHIVQDWKGNICEIAKKFSPEYLRSGIDFVTRRWVKCPVENWDDWQAMKNRYNANDPARLPADASALGAKLGKRTWPITFHFSGPFWQMREWLGFEQLCVLFYDDPDMVRDMVAFWTDYVTQLMENAFKYVIPDEIHISEDMAYKAFSMISPEMAREFLLPAWKKWGEVVRSYNIPIYGMDSDGFVGQLIPLWIEAGINVCDPMEVAAHNDIVAMREEFGNKMAFRGGIDKRKMAAGGKELEEEFLRIKPVVDNGGYIPSCDHGIPPDVSWPNYLQYMKGLAKLTGWL